MLKMLFAKNNRLYKVEVFSNSKRYKFKPSYFSTGEEDEAYSHAEYARARLGSDFAGVEISKMNRHGEYEPIYQDFEEVY